MGRARRDQRDAIRKQRAAKRRKRGNGQSDLDVVETNDDIVVWFKSEKRESLTTVNMANVASLGKSDTSVPVDLPELPISILTNVADTDQTEAPAVSSSCVKESEKQTPSKHLDKLERMRRKKRQQKARRREKKAARNVRAS
eukprot:Nitzschia sp. Nitz4//scaffold367_size14546//11876//12301//NITZ4_008928-RA/size14546-processed-gene-0.12-mRNA-1//-1//CDS//3329549333//9361//frame0